MVRIIGKPTKKNLDLIGKKYNYITIIGIGKIEKRRNRYKRLYLLECDCGNQYLGLVDNIVNGRTKSCGCQRGKTKKEIYKNKIIGKKFNGLTVLESVTKKNKNMYWKCVCDCGENTIVSTSNLGRTKSCGKCNLLIKTKKHLIKEWNFQKNKDINIDQVTSGSKKKVWWKCKKCQHEWLASIQNRAHKSNPKGCPKCNTSKNEKIIEKILNKYGIDYNKQKVFDNCKHKRRLRFDFYLPEYNICIEYNGQQHYKPIEYFGGEEKLKYTKKLDNIKRNFCKQNNIELIEISYKDNTTHKIQTIIGELI